MSDLQVVATCYAVSAQVLLGFWLTDRVLRWRDRRHQTRFNAWQKRHGWPRPR